MSGAANRIQRGKSVRRVILAVFLVVGCAVFSGCAHHYITAVGEKGGEEFSGDITMAGDKNQVIMRNDRDIVCRGGLVFVGSALSLCEGQRYLFELLCSDARVLRGELTASSCTEGFGVGADWRGNRYAVAFGNDRSEVRQKARALALPGGTGKGGGKKDGTTVSSGTGFFVSDDGVVVTNAHVVEGRDVFTVFTAKSPEGHPARLLARDDANDVAVLKVDGITARPLALAAEFTARRGEEVLTLGYPLPDLQGMEQKATFGRVNSLTGLHDDIRHAQVDLPIQPGNSGGPLLNRRGEVLGITTATVNNDYAKKAYGATTQNVNFAVKVDYIHPLLRKAAPGVKPGTGRPGLSMEQVVSACEDSVVRVEGATTRK